MKSSLRQATALALLMAPLPPAPTLASEALLSESCGGCHMETEQGLSRISEQRKTPEGWLMTIVRMRTTHGASVSLADQATLVRYLADTQGMTPSETAPFRYALDRTPWAQDASADGDLNAMCGRCHTVARVGLQRRSGEEWSKLIDFHVGEFPTLEFQASSRDRDWLRLAREEVVPYLTEVYGEDDAAWHSWNAADHVDPAGDWVVLTSFPGLGQLYGRLNVSGASSPYSVSGSYRTADGSELPVTGAMNFYSGFEWRAMLTVGDKALRQVLAINPETGLLEGRQFLAAQDSMGATLTAAKLGSAPAVLGTVPAVAPVGSTEVQIIGAGLSGDGLAATPYGLKGTVTGRNGTTEIPLGDLSATMAFYDHVDSLKVEPAFTIARVGGGGPTLPAAVPASFAAIGYWNGADGEPGTADDIRIGELPAAWTLSNRDEIAEAMQDLDFVGKLDAATGVFSPALGGPNPARKFSTNNAGDLTVTATAVGLSAEARMVVTVQRFIDPPIR